MKKILFIIILSATIGCGNNNSTPSNDQETPEAKVSTANEIEKSPCELVSESDIKNLFSIPENVTTDINNTVRTYPTCFYKWKTIQFSETKKIGNSEVSINYPTEMSIVLVKDATEKMYETSIKVYKDGATENGIGDMATWGGKMSQLTFLSNGYMIHLFVKKSAIESENKEIANKIAALITEQL